MRKFFFQTMLAGLFSLLMSGAQAQTSTSEAFGHTFNAGIGIGGYAGYYSYLSGYSPIIHLDYEFDVARSFTLAPFANFYTHKESYYWGNNNNPYRYYTYRETVIPIGVKGTLYLDKLLNLYSKWDVYLAGSLGVGLVVANWESGYGGDKNSFNRANTLYLDGHLGAEYHATSKLGIFLDLSSGVSTVGLAFH